MFFNNKSFKEADSIDLRRKHRLKKNSIMMNRMNNKR